MSEKVRYYLEQSVPELEDLLNKGLFEKNEVTMIMRRRTDFEHRIQGRGSTTRDFLKYAAFEKNLEKLRKKRYTRLSKVGLVDTKPSLSDWAGVRRILFIFQRATFKYPKSLDIWSEYLEFAKKNGAIKVIYKIYSRLLQLQPRNVNAWLSAAKYEFETNNNAKGSRVLFQRGLRLNPESNELWLNYFQFELTYISKLLTRRKVLGLITDKQQQEQHEKEVKEYNDKLAAEEDDDGDTIALPTDAIRDELNTLPEADMNMLGNPETNPALKGDVALAVFDAALIANKNTRSDKIFILVNKFLEIIDKFDDLNQEYLYFHVISYLHDKFAQDIRTALIDMTLPIRTAGRRDQDFAAKLQLSVNKFMAYKADKNLDQKEMINSFVGYLDRFVEGEDELMRAIIRKCSI